MAVNPRGAGDWYHTFQGQVEELLRHLLNLERRMPEREFTPLVDIYDADGRVVVEVELPGFVPENLSVRICYHVLVIEGIKRHDCHGRAVNYLCMERQFGRFHRLVQIPLTADLGEVRASYTDRGILRISFAKQQESPPLIRQIPIE
jgi:HSP20 family protein